MLNGYLNVYNLTVRKVLGPTAVYIRSEEKKSSQEKSKEMKCQKTMWDVRLVRSGEKRTARKM